jgi:hypothetical protein
MGLPAIDLLKRIVKRVQSSPLISHRNLDEMLSGPGDLSGRNLSKDFTTFSGVNRMVDKFLGGVGD